MTTVCTVSGTLKNLQGETLADTAVGFSRAGVVSQYGDAIIPFDVQVVSDGSGAVSFDIYPGNYVGTSSPVSGRVEKFTMAVPEATTADLADLIGGPGENITTGLTQLTAELSAETAARIAGDDANTGGTYYAGPWDAASGAFPSVRFSGGAVQLGDYFDVSVAGTFSGEDFEVGERIKALVDAPSTTTLAGNWYYADTIAILAPIQAEVDVNTARLAALPYAVGSFAELANLEYSETPAGRVVSVAGVGDYIVQPVVFDSLCLDYTASGGVKLLPIDSVGITVEQWGADPDAADNFTAMQSAINADAIYGYSRLIWADGTYACSEDLYFCHSDANPGYPDDDLLSGRSIYQGAGKMTRRDYANDTYSGSVIDFATGKKAIMSRPQNSLDQDDSARGWARLVQDMSFVGDNEQIIYDPYMASFSNYERIFVGTEATSAGVAVFYVSDNYVCGYTDIEIIGSKDLSENLVGYGFHAEPSDTAGGANRYVNITAAYFDKPLVFGRIYDPAATGITDSSKANFMLNCQGQKCNVGIHFLQNVIAFKVQSCWVESALVAPVKVSHSAENIEFNGCNFVMQGGALGDRGGIVVGDTTGNANFDHARNIIIENNRFRAEAGTAGVMVNDAAQDVFIRHNSFLNAGGAAVAIQGGMGGEVTLYGNDYQPTIAAVAVPLARRFCILSGTGATGGDYDNVSHMALDIDYQLSALAEDLDASSWRRPPKRVNLLASDAELSITLPTLDTSLRQDCHIRCSFGPAHPHDVVVDAGTGKTIKGAQTHVLPAAYSHIEITGGSANRWDVLSE